MAKVERSIIINAPIEEVYDFTTDVENFAEAHLPEYEMKNLTKPEKPLKVNQTWKISMKIGDKATELENEITEVEENNKIVVCQKIGPLKSQKITQSFKPDDGETKYAITFEYELPHSFNVEFHDSFKKQVEKIADYQVKKTKELIEKR